jgi:hypothetical protein
MSRGVLAMRLRLALLRQKISIEVDRLIADRAYAQDVLAMCKSMDQADLISLAERLVLSEDDEPSGSAPASPAERAASAASSRFHQGSGSAAAPTASTASRPMSTLAPTTGGGTTGFDDPATADPDDPDSPRSRRYLRGAR